MVYCELARDTNYPGRLNPQKEKDDHDLPDSFSAAGSGGRDCFCRGGRRGQAPFV
jgi:hypothetical protein